jgi:hypothetical protein
MNATLYASDHLDPSFNILSLSYTSIFPTRCIMFEPHLNGFDNDRPYQNGGDGGSSLLEELDKMAPIQRFDAFPKVCLVRLNTPSRLTSQVQSTYISQSRRGGVLTALVGSIIFLLVLVSLSLYLDPAADDQNDLGEFLYGAPDYAFTVDHTIEKDLQLNVDMTVAMPCHCKSDLWKMC